MATPTAKIDSQSAPAAARGAVEARVLPLVRDLLIELGSHHALEEVPPRAHLEKDLALGSLERVELVSRISRECGVDLPDRIVAEADTVADLISAVLNPGTASPKVDSSSLSSTSSTSLTSTTSSLPGAGELPNAQTFLDVLQHRGTVDASRLHILLREENESTHLITFGELFERAQAVARGLRARGLAPGQCVALMLPTSEDFFASFAGILLAGGIAVPIYPPMRADRLEEYAKRQAAILRSAEARFLITFRRAEAVAHLLHPHVPSLKEVVTVARLSNSARPGHWKNADRDTDEILHEARARDIACLQYTSGSTGEPKGVILTHANLLANIRSIIAVLGINDKDVAVSWLPLYHDMGLIGCWLMPLYFGMKLAVMSPLAFLTRPERWLWAVHHNKGTLAAAPNFAFELCVRKIQDRDIEGLDLSSWRALLNGAEPINPGTLDRFCERFSEYGFRPEALLPVYGLAEATLAVTAPEFKAPNGNGRPWRIDRIDRAKFESDSRAVPAAEEDPAPLEFVSVGRAIPGYEVRITDDSGKDVPGRAEGNLWFRGMAATQGYYRNPAATAEILKGDGWIDSGDRAYADQGEIFITGRVKDIIIKAGRNIYPHEVEEAAGGAEGVRRGCVVAFGVTDAQAGTERLVVVAETKGNFNGAMRAKTEAAVMESVADAIGVPADVVELVPPASIPKTSSGKLRRSETRKLYLAGKLTARKLPAWVQVARFTVASSARAARSTLRRVFDFLYGCYSAVAFAVFLLPTWTACYFAPTKELACRWTQIGNRIFFRMMFIPITERGWENVQPGKTYVFVCNHTSFFDILIFLALFKFPYRFVSKQEVAHWPFIGTFIRRRTDFAFDRSDRNARLAQAETLERSLRENVSILVYPEGTFVAAPGVRPFQLGAFKAAIATGCPVVPIALRGIREILRDDTTLPRPGRIHVTILPPLEPNPHAPEFQEMIRLRDASRIAIAEHSGEHLL
jgi:1-acyl-sn-glycerol-3-phosphate acyltransferase